MNGATPTPPTLATLLSRHRHGLEAFVRRHAAGLLRFETTEDLTQGVVVQVLQRSGGFDYRGEEEFRAWLHMLARRFLGDRNDHWRALKRGAGRVVRLTFSDGTQGDLLSGLLPDQQQAGPATFAARRELLLLAIRALGTLPPRDQQLVRLSSEGASLEEQAERLEISYAAVQRASLRAMERFRKAFRLVAGS